MATSQRSMEASLSRVESVPWRDRKMDKSDWEKLLEDIEARGLEPSTHPNVELAEESVTILGISLEMVTGEEPVGGKGEANVC